MNRKKTKRDYVKNAIEILRSPSTAEGQDSNRAARRVLVDELEELRGKNKPHTDADLLLLLAKKLKEVKEFGYPRRVLRLARSLVRTRSKTDSTRLAIYQQSAVTTYKDPDLPAERRLKEALQLLKEGDDLETTTIQETLGIAGAIYKRMWEANNQRQDLETAQGFYQRGREQGVARDQGYTAINEAYLLDLLASLDAKQLKAATEVEEMREKARKIRLQIIDEVLPLAETKDGAYLKGEWWYYSTIGEAYFGLQEYEKAVQYLNPENLEVPEWERESTAAQLASLARVQFGADMPEDEFEKTGAGWALKEFLNNENSEAVRGAFIGKIGLALSGGGFRASLFHIGVLARLAELDLLRRVEVLSCVSGGSIIGAHYYLELKRLLETKRDARSKVEYRDPRDANEREWITHQDYIDIVHRLERHFLAGVQRNVRTRVAASLLTNLKMIFKPGFSRTLRAGELYESEIFSRVDDRNGNEKRKKRLLNELRVKPAIGGGKQQDDFNPKSHNWKRGAKVPVLILNAATLNTGHSWHFTVTYMGEPPGSIDTEIDGNYRLRRMYYQDAPGKPTNHQEIRLGDAVAASACVPAVFEPLSLKDLYEEVRINPEIAQGKELSPQRLRVRLVDGGVCDNQGVMGLMEQECNVLLVSDASGQMETQPMPGAGLLNVPIRSSNILQSRVRSEQYRHLRERRHSGLLRGLMFIHLKQDLGVKPLNWRLCPPHLAVSEFDQPEQYAGDVTSYGVAKDVQQSLAAVRTDLDSFCDVEADALMASGYLMTKSQLMPLSENDERAKPAIDGINLTIDKQAEVPWRFRKIEPYLGPETGVEDPGQDPILTAKRKENLRKIIGASNSLGFKIWKLSPALKLLSGVLVTTLIFFLLYLIVWSLLRLSGRSIFTAEQIKWLVSRLTDERIVYTSSLLTLGNLTLAAVIAIVVIAVAVWLINCIGKYLGVVRWSDTLTSIVFGIIMTFPGFIAAWLHLKVFDSLFLRWGSREKFYGRHVGDEGAN
jgi:predicted acylesterase/phospholipase RssA